MRVLLLLIVISICYGCNQHKKEHSEISYFEFDRVEHFRINISESKVDSFLIKENPSTTEKYFIKIVAEDYPKKVTDIDTNKLVALGYTKTNLPASRYQTIRNIFSNKPSSDGYTMSCIPVYRDIMVFFKNKKISGIAKICFGCHQYHFVGEKIVPASFGSDNDYTNLSKVLRE